MLFPFVANTSGTFRCDFRKNDAYSTDHEYRGITYILSQN